MRTPVILIKGAGEMASAVAHRLFKAGFFRTCLIDIAQPLAVRRTVSYCPALEAAEAKVEDVVALRVDDADSLQAAWVSGCLGVALADRWHQAPFVAPDIVVDAILAKRNLGTGMSDAPWVIALGPGFEAGRDAHLVIETNRGHDLGRIIEQGFAAPNTGIPGDIAGYTKERVLRAPADGTFKAKLAIADPVEKGQIVGTVAGLEIPSPLSGVVRGLIQDGTPVTQGLKIGDIDPRGVAANCFTISDKARAIAGAVLEAVMRHVHR
jgi:xanthine dehydrogenase accessory factor